MNNENAIWWNLIKRTSRPPFSCCLQPDEIEYDHNTQDVYECGTRCDFFFKNTFETIYKTNMMRNTVSIVGEMVYTKAVYKKELVLANGENLGDWW